MLAAGAYNGCNGTGSAGFEALVHDRREILLLLFGPQDSWAHGIPVDEATCCFSARRSVGERIREYFQQKGAHALHEEEEEGNLINLKR